MWKNWRKILHGSLLIQSNDFSKPTILQEEAFSIRVAICHWNFTLLYQLFFYSRSKNGKQGTEFTFHAPFKSQFFIQKIKIDLCLKKIDGWWVQVGHIYRIVNETFPSQGLIFNFKIPSRDFTSSWIDFWSQEKDFLFPKCRRSCHVIARMKT